jgi:hypothetical protein
MPLQKHTVFICFTKNHRDYTMAPLPASETVLDDEGNAPTERGRGKPLENGQRMAILQALLCRFNWRNHTILYPEAVDQECMPQIMGSAMDLVVTNSY